MATFHFTRKFVERCQDFIRNNPRIAESPQKLILRAGRMAVYILSEKFGDCEDPEETPLENEPSGEFREETIPIRIPDKDVQQVRRLIRKLGLGRTVINFYYFATWMVLLGIWKLPEKPPY